MPTQINININGFGVGGSSGDRHVLDYSERNYGDRVEVAQRWEDEFYTLKPGFSPVGYLHAERKLKKKKAKNCSNGQVCGFSCISKSKVCKANMTTAQLMEHNKAKRLEKSGNQKSVNNESKGVTAKDISKYGKLSKDEKDAAKSYLTTVKSWIKKGHMDDALKKYWEVRREFGYAKDQVQGWETTDLTDDYNKNVYETGARRARIFGEATRLIEKELFDAGKSIEELDAYFDRIEGKKSA